MTDTPNTRYVPAAGDIVATTKDRGDIPAGSQGRVVGFEAAGRIVTVEFADGRRKYFAAQYLRLVWRGNE